MGIDAAFGVANLNLIRKNFPEDDELQNGLKEFATNCSAAYIQVRQAGYRRMNIKYRRI